MALKYYCDKCGKEMKIDDVYGLTIRKRKLFSYDPPEYRDDIDLCVDCMDKVVMLIEHDDKTKD